ncbi:uncharacterized protein LOC125047626 isoform X2 [Penaeus chinensis]|uniref:uncharacterized protein LOC125047626 isoform X2 n=1 Tax=Penaeus chinensis TaxID=139456 RepID=UPI001FB6CC41|nr:uncharacterized protein LOC125047626 isoform X2 [Penaeus chinensis]
MEKVEYRAVIRFLYLNGRTPQQTFNEMKATYGEDAPSYYVVKHWHRQFRCGRKSVETAPIPGRPQSAIDEDTIHQVESAILEDSCITVRQLAQDVKISVGGSFVKSYNTFWAGVATEKVTISLVPQDSGTPTTANTSPSTTTTTTPPTTTTSSPAPGSDSVMACRSFNGEVDVLMAFNDGKNNELLADVRRLYLPFSLIKLLH